MELCTVVRRYLCLIAFFCIPAYFASQAKEVLSNAGAPHIVLGHDESENEEYFSLIPLPPPVHSASSPLPRAWNNNPSFTASTSSQTSKPIQRCRDVALESSWITCVNHWCTQWRIIASVAFTILAGSSALLQMPGTNGDPLTRCFVYLFILRLISALLSAGALLYYFSKSQFRSVNFAMIWCQNVKHHRQSCLYIPWTILALPTIAISWGCIFMLLAVFLSVWGNGLYVNLPSVEKVSPLVIMSLRVIITTMSVVDVGWVWWLVARLKSFDKAVKAVTAPG